MGRSRRPILSSETPNDDGIAGSSDDSTHPPSLVRPPQIENSSPILSERRSGGNNENLNEPAAEDVASPATETAKPPRRDQGLAKCIEFDKLRKHGKIPLKINDGQTSPFCENATVFTTRVIWILKNHGDMSYPRWTNVPMVEKEELMNRVRVDFILDWDLDNHRKAVWKQLRKRFNAFHDEIHKKYLSYDSHEEALASALDMVGQHVWAKLCDRWGSEAFKCSTTLNLVEFYKEVCWSKKNDAFVTEMMGDLYNQMVGKMLDLEPRQRSEEATTSVFRDVLGYRPGYAKGLGEMIIPDSTKKKDRECQKRYAEEVERHKKVTEYYKSEFEELRASVRVFMERQTKYDKTLSSLVNTIQSQRESHRETYGD